MKQKLLLALSVAYSLCFIFWDLSFADVFYWMNRTDYYREEFMNILSVVVAKGWMGLWGNSLVMFRLLGWLCCATAMVLPYVTLQPWKDAKQKLWLLALGFVLMGTGTFRLYNPDSLTLLWLSVGTVLLFKSFSSERQIYVWGLALTCALAAAARFPNILFCPLVAVLIIAESLIVKNTKRGAGLQAYWFSRGCFMSPSSFCSPDAQTFGHTPLMLS